MNVSIFSLIEILQSLISILNVLTPRNFVTLQLIQDVISIRLVFLQSFLVFHLIVFQLGSILSSWRLDW